MKKVSVVFMMCLYLAFTTGVVVNTHYCMNKVDTVSFYTTSAEYCNTCGMHYQDATGCCHDDVTIFKIEDDHNAGKTISINEGKLIKAAFHTYTSNFNFSFYPVVTSIIPIYKPPPENWLMGDKNNVYKINCSFLI